jgi:hypothetical protein
MVKPCANMTMLPAARFGAISFRVHPRRAGVGHQDHDDVGPFRDVAHVADGQPASVALARDRSSPAADGHRRRIA